MKPHIIELLRPWKLTVLAIGIALLYVGMWLTPADDWTHRTIWAMALPAYATSGWSMRVLVERRWRDWPLALFFGWVSVDGAWLLAIEPHAMHMRDVNIPASAALFAMLGLVLMFNGPLRDVPGAWRALRAA